MKKLLQLLGTILVTSNALGSLVANKSNNNRIKNNLQILNRQKRQVFNDLHFAIHENDIKKVKFLLSQLVDVNKEDEQGWIPLFIAVKNNNLNIVQELLTNENSKNKININIKNKFDQTALHFAAQENNTEIANLLFDNGANINVINDKSQTPLHIAVQSGNLVMVKLLLDYGVATDVIDDDGNTALMLAENRKYLDIIKLLIENKTNNDNDNMSVNSDLSLILEKRQVKNKKDKQLTQNSPSKNIKHEFINEDLTLDENYSRNIQQILDKLTDKNHISPLRKIGGFLANHIDLGKNELNEKEIEKLKDLKVILDEMKKSKNMEKILILKLHCNEKNIKLVIRLKDFYLQGYINNKEEYFFYNDSEVKKVDNTKSIKLDYDSNYRSSLENISISCYESVENAIDELLKNENQKNNLIKLVFLTSEAMRFGWDNEYMKIIEDILYSIKKTKTNTEGINFENILEAAQDILNSKNNDSEVSANKNVKFIRFKQTLNNWDKASENLQNLWTEGIKILIKFNKTMDFIEKNKEQLNNLLNSYSMNFGNPELNSKNSVFESKQLFIKIKEITDFWNDETSKTEIVKKMQSEIMKIFISKENKDIEKDLDLKNYILNVVPFFLLIKIQFNQTQNQDEINLQENFKQKEKLENEAKKLFEKGKEYEAVKKKHETLKFITFDEIIDNIPNIDILSLCIFFDRLDIFKILVLSDSKKILNKFYYNNLLTPVSLAFLLNKKEFKKEILMKLIDDYSLESVYNIYLVQENFCKNFSTTDFISKQKKLRKLRKNNQQQPKEEYVNNLLNVECDNDDSRIISMIIGTQSQNFSQDKQNIIYNVPGDDSCLFWSVVMAYLLPVRNNNEEFKNRFIKLFGILQLSSLSYMQDLLQQFDLTNNSLQVLYQDATANRLIRGVFRNRVVEYIERNLDNPIQRNINNEQSETFRSAIQVSGNEISVNNYLERMRNINTWGGQIEILAIGNMLNVNINESNQNIFTTNNSNENIQIFHVESKIGSGIKNHYNFGLSQQHNIDSNVTSINAGDDLKQNGDNLTITTLKPLQIDEHNQYHDISSIKKDNSNNGNSTAITKAVDKYNMLSSEEKQQKINEINNHYQNLPEKEQKVFKDKLAAIGTVAIGGGISAVGTKITISSGASIASNTGVVTGEAIEMTPLLSESTVAEGLTAAETLSVTEGTAVVATEAAVIGTEAGTAAALAPETLGLSLVIGGLVIAGTAIFWWINSDHTIATKHESHNQYNEIEKYYKFLAHDQLKLSISNDKWNNIRQIYQSNLNNYQEFKNKIKEEIINFHKEDHSGWGGSINENDFEILIKILFNHFKEIDNHFTSNSNHGWKIITNTIGSYFIIEEE